MMLPKPNLTQVQSWLLQPKHMFAGKTALLGKGNEFALINPAQEKELLRYKMSSAEDVKAVIAKASDLHRRRDWAKMSMRVRAQLMRKMGEVIRRHHNELAVIETLQNGKTYAEAYFDDIPDSADVFDYYAGWIGKHYGDNVPVEDGFINYTSKEPVGVCGLIVPWNFPLLLGCWKIAAAISCGNPVVVKPSEYTPLTMLYIFEAWMREIPELPDGLLNLVLGDGQVGSWLSADSQIAKITFTGSTNVGRQIIRSSADSNLKSVTLELGGKSANIIFSDAPDLGFAIERSFTAMFSHKGEKCSEPTRLLVHESLKDRVLAELKNRADAVVCGDPFDAKTTQGAQAQQQHFEKILSYIVIGKTEASLLAGGSRDAGANGGKGLFVRPTIFVDVPIKARIAQEEIFGPVLSVSTFKTDEQAVELANGTPFGLAAGLWTADVSRAHSVAAQLDAGMVFVNRYGCYDFTSPFGGFKASGWGKEMGRESLEAFTKTKSIWIKL